MSRDRVDQDQRAETTLKGGFWQSKEAFDQKNILQKDNIFGDTNRKNLETTGVQLCKTGHQQVLFGRKVPKTRLKWGVNFPRRKRTSGTLAIRCFRSKGTTTSRWRESSQLERESSGQGNLTRCCLVRSCRGGDLLRSLPHIKTEVKLNFQANSESNSK